MDTEKKKQTINQALYHASSIRTPLLELHFHGTETERRSLADLIQTMEHAQGRIKAMIAECDAVLEATDGRA